MEIWRTCGIIVLLAMGTSTILPGQTAKEDVQSGRLPRHKGKNPEKSGKKNAKTAGHKVRKHSQKSVNKAPERTRQGAARARQDTQTKWWP
jgi:hypothetical protein